MKTKFLAFAILTVFVLSGFSLYADEDERNVEPFSEISLRVPGKLYLEQGSKQSIEIVAKASTLDDIITEVKDRKLIIRFPKKNYFWKNFDPGKIVIYVTVPEVDALAISGSGDIIVEDEIDSRIIDLAVSGSGDIDIAELNSERVKVSISGSGDIDIASKKTATDFSVAISGSGNVKALDFPAEDVMVRVSGSGDCAVHAKNKLTIKVAGSGDVVYRGNPRIDQNVAGSGSVRNVN